MKTGSEPIEYILEFVNNDKPTLLFTEGAAQKQPDASASKSEADLELLSLIKFKGNTLLSTA